MKYIAKTLKLSFLTFFSVTSILFTFISCTPKENLGIEGVEVFRNEKGIIKGIYLGEFEDIEGFDYDAFRDFGHYNNGRAGFIVVPSKELEIRYILICPNIIAATDERFKHYGLENTGIIYNLSEDYEIPGNKKKKKTGHIPLCAYYHNVKLTPKAEEKWEEVRLKLLSMKK